MVEFGLPVEELKVFLKMSLNSRERQLLLDCSKLEGYTFSNIVKSVGKSCPPSTAKLVLKRLKGFGLVEFGDSFNVGRPLAFTKLGKIFLEILRGDGDG